MLPPLAPAAAAAPRWSVRLALLANQVTARAACIVNGCRVKVKPGVAHLEGGARVLTLVLISFLLAFDFVFFKVKMAFKTFLGVVVVLVAVVRVHGAQFPGCVGGTLVGCPGTPNCTVESVRALCR